MRHLASWEAPSVLCMSRSKCWAARSSLRAARRHRSEAHGDRPYHTHLGGDTCEEPKTRIQWTVLETMCSGHSTLDLFQGSTEINT